MNRQRMVVVLGVVITTLLGSMVAAAQDATPAAPAPQPIVPTANQCTATPRDIAFFAQLVGTPVAAPAAATPADSEPFQMPEGEPPDRTTQRGVLDTLRHLAACLNAGNTLAVYALYTDDYFFAVAAVEGPMTEAGIEAMAAEPAPPPAGSQSAILAIHQIRFLPDGRVAVMVDIVHPLVDPSGPTRIVFLLAEQDGHWLIDEEIVVEGD